MCFRGSRASNSVRILRAPALPVAHELVSFPLGVIDLPRSKDDLAGDGGRRKIGSDPTLDLFERSESFGRPRGSLLRSPRATFLHDVPKHGARNEDLPLGEHVLGGDARA